MVGGATIRYGANDTTVDVDGTTASFMIARDWPVAEGDFIDDNDVKGYATVAVLGRSTADDLFPDGSDPIGRYIIINNVPFLVIGIMTEKGATPYGADQDDIVFVPVTTASIRLFGRKNVRSLTVQVDDVSEIEATENAITEILIKRHRAEDFRVRNMASILETATETQNTLTYLLGAVGAISLLVGGIGVMNIMLVSVTERTREIGIRVATGARKANILQQFITEALVVSAIGGTLGVAIGLSMAWFISTFGLPVAYSPTPVILAFCCAFFTGLIFGYMPARKAATLDPVVALGAE
jgi:macrolide transport system ATP-binding/permease protein